jgi:hypothetical protein
MGHERKRRVAIPQLARPCALCGRPFVATRADAKFCRVAHRVQAHRERRRFLQDLVDNFLSSDPGDFLG